MTSAPKTVTVLSQHPSYGSDNAFTGLDLALAYSVFDQPVNYLFVDQGVLQLVENQRAESLPGKNLGAALGALKVYGIEQVFVDKQSLEFYGLNLKDLVVDAKALDTEQLKDLVADSSLVYTL